jgi:hypothetical protein
MTTTGLPGLWPMRKQRRRRIAALTVSGPPSGAMIPQWVSAWRSDRAPRLESQNWGESRQVKRLPGHTDRPSLGGVGGRRVSRPPTLSETSNVPRSRPSVKTRFENPPAERRAATCRGYRDKMAVRG